jgi:pimeloyl-ACP methyl ester carboxylesterase
MRFAEFHHCSALLSLVAACSPTRERRQIAQFELHACAAPATHAAARCGSISLPENRSVPTGRTIHLAVLILPATDSLRKLEPIVFLHGGPGMPATRADDYVTYALGPSHARHDLVMVDMRGTGGDDALTCDLYADSGRMAPYLAPMFPLDLVRECAARLSRRADLTQYTSENAARDLDELRSALHVDRWSLFGASYGTRLSLVYMRMFPEHVRRAALLGVLPPESPTGRAFSGGGQQALDSAVAECAREMECRREVPDARGDVSALLDRLRRNPLTVTLWNAHRLSLEHVTLTAHAAAEGLFIAAYYPPTLMRLLRVVHHAVASGDMKDLTRQFVALSRSKRTARAVGLALSVWCAEDISRLTPRDTLAAGSLLGIPALPAIMDACGVWPHAPLPPGFSERVRSAIPTLLISGGRDPATPFYLADSAAKGLSRVERYHDAAAGHAALDDRARNRMAVFFAAP